MVLFHLVSGGVGAVFRCECAAVDDFAGVECDYWGCSLYQHDSVGEGGSKVGNLANNPAVYDAVLCLKFFSVGEGKRICADLLTESNGDTGGDGDLRGVVWDGVCAEA